MAEGWGRLFTDITWGGAWYVITPPHTPYPLTASSLWCVFLIRLLHGGVFHPNTSIFYISWQPKFRVNKAEQTSTRRTHLHSPGTLQVPCSGLHPGRQMAFGGKRNEKVWTISVIFKTSAWLGHFAQSLTSTFLCLVVCENVGLVCANNGWKKAEGAYSRFSNILWILAKWLLTWTAVNFRSVSVKGSEEGKTGKTKCVRP